MPHRLIFSRIEPLVRHGVWEQAQGAPVAHVLRQIGAMSFLAGQGLDPREAFRRVEEWERLGYFPEVSPLSRYRFEMSERIHAAAPGTVGEPMLRPASETSY